MTSEQTQTWRVFCAIDLPASVRELMVEHVSGLRRAVPNARARWSRPENSHLTLKFYGDIPTTEVKNVEIAAARAVEGLSRFEIQLGEAGMFPSPRAPRVLWLGVHDSTGKLADLQARLEDESATLGFEKETRAFKPHLTLARLRGSDHRRSHAREEVKVSRQLAAVHAALQFEKVEITVAELLVIRSELNQAGAKYTVLSRHELEMSDELSPGN